MLILSLVLSITSSGPCARAAATREPSDVPTVLRMIDRATTGDFGRRLPARPITALERKHVRRTIRDLYPWIDADRANLFAEYLLNVAASSEFVAQLNVPTALDTLADQLVVDLVRAELSSPEERRPIVRKAAARVEWATLLTIGRRTRSRGMAESIKDRLFFWAMIDIFLGGLPISLVPTPYQHAAAVVLGGLGIGALVGSYLPDKVIDRMASPIYQHRRRTEWSKLERAFWFRVEEGLAESGGWRNFVAGRGRGGGAKDVAADVRAWMHLLVGDDFVAMCDERLSRAIQPRELPSAPR